MPAVVELLVLADGVDQIDMLLLVGVAAAASGLGSCSSPLVPWTCSETLAPRVVLLAALAEHLRAVVVGELDEVVVVDLADAAVVAAVAAAHAVGLDGMVVLDAQLVIAQLQTSRLWTCCSTMWSPQSQTKWYQLRIWYSISVWSGWRSRTQIGSAVPVGPHEGDVADRAVVDPLDALRDTAC